MTWSLDTAQGRLPVADAKQLRTQLTQLHESNRAAPAIVMLNAPDGACLCIGLGHALASLSWIAPGGWPAKHVVGTDGTEGLLPYSCAGQYTEIPAGQAVPIEQAISVALEFFESGRLSEGVEWGDD
jgi:hypothetical protein